jgi:alpha-ketoglutarate-dependent taurine dioxygenase
VLVFRDQDLGAPELAAFGRRFGSPRPHALIKYRHADCPEVSWLTNVEETGKIDWYGVKRATDWHTDSTFEDTLPLLAVLHAKEVPSEKGGTMFADMRAAYEALPGQGNSCCPASPACTAAALVPPASACMATTRA